MLEGGGDLKREAGRELSRADRAPLLTPLQHFYRTSSLPCPYLPSRIERKLVTELVPRDGEALYNELSRAGFRRSHHLAYRPACAGCDSCVPVRIDVQAFAPSRSQRRVFAANADLGGTEAAPIATPEQYRLFFRYQRSRHAQSDMAAMSFGDYRAMIEDSPVDTALIELRDAGGRGRLVGGCLVDRLDDGYSAVYSFFDPALAERSLGTFAVLWLVEAARRRGAPYVYLGYWIGSSPKMSYKTRFRPLEALGPDGWRRLDP
jgi:arginine-tRNA-protein transferase